MNIQTVDIRLIRFFREISFPVARVSLFIVFFWFGLLKILGLSPAGELVQALYEETISFVPFATFYVLFGLLEMAIGVLFLFPRAVRVVIPLLLAHMLTTFLPLFFLPEIAWQRWFVPTLEGQYIIKNLVIIATTLFIAAHAHPLPPKIT
ncbi:MAG: hypothetical protein AMXMBFR44_4320 [Candidatus Campbellbacteria bacterium]